MHSPRGKTLRLFNINGRKFKVSEYGEDVIFFVCVDLYIEYLKKLNEVKCYVK